VVTHVVTDTCWVVFEKLYSDRARKCFWELDVKYRRPCLAGEGDQPDIPLMYIPFGRVYEKPSIPRDAFLDAVREIYASVYDIAKPDLPDNDAFGKLGDPITCK
jgi:hypothetical protein